MVSDEYLGALAVFGATNLLAALAMLLLMDLPAFRTWLSQAVGTAVRWVMRAARALASFAADRLTPR